MSLVAGASAEDEESLLFTTSADCGTVREESGASLRKEASMRRFGELSRSACAPAAAPEFANAPRQLLGLGAGTGGVSSSDSLGAASW